MTGSILARMAGLLVLLVLVSLLVFGALNLLPGDPASVMLGTSARPDTLAALRLELGLDRPFLLRWLEWLSAALRGDFGISLTYGVPVSTLVAQRLVVTLPLAALALALALALGLPLGVAAAGRGRVAEAAATALGQIGVAIPNFWLALLLMLVFASTLGWLPAGGFPGWSDPVAALRSLLLPAIALGLPQAAVLVRVTRASVIEAMSEPFVRTALAKGLRRRTAIRRHALPNALLPIATILGLKFSFLVAGAVLVENIFSLPGLGQLAYQSLMQRDFITLQAVALLLAGTTILVNGLIDLSYRWIDPRIRDAE